MLFHRVDDIGEDIRCDIDFIEMFEAARVPYIVAVIPTRLSRSVARRIRDCRNCTVFQHGFAHRRTAVAGRQDEFLGCNHETHERLAEGRARLEDQIGSAVFGYTPPWNNTSAATLAILEDLGFKWFSGHVRHAYKTRMLQLNVSIDPVRCYRPLRLHAPRLLYLKLGTSLLMFERVGIVFHPKCYSDAYSLDIARFFKMTAFLSCSIPNWLDLLAC